MCVCESVYVVDARGLLVPTEIARQHTNASNARVEGLGAKEDREVSKHVNDEEGKHEDGAAHEHLAGRRSERRFHNFAPVRAKM